MTLCINTLTIHHYARFFLGAGAAVYLAGFVFFPSSWDVWPLLLCSTLFGIAVLIRRASLDSLRSERGWLGALLLFFSVNAFLIWFHAGDLKYAETAGKALLTLLLLWPLLVWKISFKAVQWGVALGLVVLGYQLWLHFDWSSRFTPYYNSTKFGFAITFLGLLSAFVAFESKSWCWRIGLAFGALVASMGPCNRYKGVVFPIAAGILIISGMLWLKVSARYRVGLIFMKAPLVVGAGQLSVVKARWSYAFDNIAAIQQLNFGGPVGYRLVMWEAGAQAGLRHPLVGQGFDYPEIMASFESDVGNKKEIADYLGGAFRLFHNVWIDAFAMMGLLGLTTLIVLIIGAFSGLSASSRRLLLAPMIGMFIGGLTDSLMHLSVTGTFFLICVTLIRAIDWNHPASINATSRSKA